MKCLDSLQSAFGNWQLIILANGKDLSPEITSKAQSLTPHLKMIKTDLQVTPGKARNLAIESVEGEWIYFIDDDAYVKPGYWEKVLPLLQDPKVDVLGGPDSPAQGMNKLSLSLALALSSPFCTGTTFSRHKSFGSKLQYANEEKLTSCNLWIRRTALGEVRFPEDFIRTEEVLVLQTLKNLGKGFFYHPLLVVGHYRRSKLRELFRPSFYAGFYRSKLMKGNPQKGSEVFWLPSFFVLLHLLIFLEPFSFWYLVRMYVSIILFISIALAMKAKRLWLFPLVAFFHYFIVFMYGLGFLFERIRRISP